MIVFSNQSRLRTVAAHVAVWTVHLFLNNILLSLDGSLSKVLQRTLITYSLVALLFYINAHYLLNRLFVRRQYGRLVAGTVLLLIGYTWARYLTFYWVFPALHIDTTYKEISLLSRKFSLDSAWIGLQYLLFSYGYWFAFHKLRLEHEQRLTVEKLAQMEREKTKAELAFLQAQLNPHFLFNTFNFLYSEAIQCSDKLANAILLLTDMMRTVTEVSKDELIPLEKEITYIENYLQIQQYRFNNKLRISLDVEGAAYLGRTFIPPLLFISVVENMFKYGDMHDAEHPAAIQFIVGENSLYFYAYNRKKADTSLLRRVPTSGGGLGLANIRVQLEILFKENHTFTVQNEEKDFTLEIGLANTAARLPRPRPVATPA